MGGHEVPRIVEGVSGENDASVRRIEALKSAFEPRGNVSDPGSGRHYVAAWFARAPRDSLGYQISDLE